MRVYMATTLSEYHQGMVLTKMNKGNRLVSYYQDGTRVKNNLKRYARKGWNRRP